MPDGGLPDDRELDPDIALLSPPWPACSASAPVGAPMTPGAKNPDQPIVPDPVPARRTWASYRNLSSPFEPPTGLKHNLPSTARSLSLAVLCSRWCTPGTWNPPARHLTQGIGPFFLLLVLRTRRKFRTVPRPLSCWKVRSEARES